MLSQNTLVSKMAEGNNNHQKNQSNISKHQYLLDGYINVHQKVQIQICLNTDFSLKVHFLLAWLSSQSVGMAVVKYSYTSLYVKVPIFSQTPLRPGSWFSCAQNLFK